MDSLANAGRSSRMGDARAMQAAQASAGEGDALSYDPNYLIDALRAQFGLDNDAALARRLRVRPPTLSKVRTRRVGVSAALLIAMHEASGLTIRDLRWLMGDRREFFSPLIDEESVTIFR
jgi:transcriptional regulator with XRE-family HTH domain